LSNTTSKLHGWGHEDYEVAKAHIWAQLGSLDGLEVFGRQVLVGVYTRPALNKRTGLTFTEREQQNDWHEGKVVLVLAHGPDAFSGDADWIKQTYGANGAPRIGEWLFQNANTGIQFSICGDGAERVQYTDRRDDKHALYPGDGWPVRIVLDDGFLGRLLKPNTVV
jgi:hypothetical protein